MYMFELILYVPVNIFSVMLGRVFLGFEAVLLTEVKVSCSVKDTTQCLRLGSNLQPLQPLYQPRIMI